MMSAPAVASGSESPAAADRGASEPGCAEQTRERSAAAAAGGSSVAGRCSQRSARWAAQMRRRYSHTARGAHLCGRELLHTQHLRAALCRERRQRGCKLVSRQHDADARVLEHIQQLRRRVRQRQRHRHAARQPRGPHCGDVFRPRLRHDAHARARVQRASLLAARSLARRRRAKRGSAGGGSGRRGALRSTQPLCQAARLLEQLACDRAPASARRGCAQRDRPAVNSGVARAPYEKEWDDATT